MNLGIIFLRAKRVLTKRIFIVADDKNGLLGIQLLERDLEVVQKALLLRKANIFILAMRIRKGFAKGECSIRPMILRLGTQTNESISYRKLHLHRRGANDVVRRVCDKNIHSMTDTIHRVEVVIVHGD